MITAILFDLDGTLLDTAQDLADATNRVLTHHSRRAKNYDFIRPLIGGGTKKIICHCFDIKPDHKNFGLYRQQLLDAYQQQLNQATRLFPGMANFLNQLQLLSIPWGIVTNKPYWLAQPLVQNMGLDKHCQCLIGSETLPVKKPHPEPLRYASQQIGVAPQQCAYIGDAITDIQAAKKANMYSIAAAYGYIQQDEHLENWQADHIVHSAHELSEWLYDILR